MKIAYIANIRFPTEKAHGVQIIKMCEAFVKSGMEIKLIIPRRLNKIKEDPFDFYGVKEKFKIVKIPCLDFVAFGKVGFLVQTMTFLFFAKIYLMLSKYNFLYTRESYSSLFFNRYILEVHSMPIKFINKVSKFIVLTSFIKKELIDLGVSENKILVAPDGVDLCQYEIKESVNELKRKFLLPLDKKIVGYSGMLKTMNMDKGIGDLIDAIKNINNTILVLVGGREEDILFYKNYAKNIDVSEKVVFVGYVKNVVVPEYLKCFDCLVAPFPDNNHYKYYMSPLKIFEYMASKKPIIVSDLPSVREVLSEDECIFFNPNNPKELAEKIDYVLNNYSIVTELSENAHKKVEDFTWDKRVKIITK